MIGRVQMSSAARGVIVLYCLVAAGCAVTRAPTEESVPAAAPGTSPPGEAPSVLTPPETSPPPAAPEPAPQAAAPEPSPVVATPTAPETQAAPQAPSAPVASPPPVAPLDFASLETQLRQTKAIGVLTKLSVKNQADDLLERFRAYHKRQGGATLPELRRSYDMLLLKVLSLVQDSDPPLAQQIVQSRAAIWDILADPRKFIESDLMAGAMT
jgi:hypothetical protein